MTEPQTYQAPAPATPASESREIPIGQMLGILWRGRWIILICALLAASAGVYYVQKRGTIWRATSRLYVDNQSLNVSGADMFLGVASRNYANTQAELLRAAPILGSALAEDEVARLEIFREIPNKIAWLKKNLKVSVGKNNDIITVSLDSKLVEDACIIVREVVDAYKAYQEKQTDTTLDAVVKQLIEAKNTDQKRLDDKIQERKNFLAENGSSGTERVAIVTSRYNSALAALQRVRDERRRTAQALNSAKAFADDPSTLLRLLASNANTRSVTSDPESDEIRARVRSYEAQLLALRAEVTGVHPGVTKLEQRIAELEKQLDKRQKRLASTYLASLEEAHTAAIAEEAKLTQQINADESIVQALSGKAIEYQSLEHDIVDARESLKAVRDRLTAVNMNKVDTATELKINVLDDARRETATVASGKATTVAILTFLGLLLGAALAWLRGLLDHRIRTVEDVSTRVGLPVTGILPRINLPKNTSALSAWVSNRSLTEAARSLRTAVYYAMSSEENRVLHITSPEPGDGKSLTTSCLGIAMAQAGQKTLIVDADMRKPRQNVMFDIDNRHGLAEILADPTAPSGIVPTEQDGLDLLPSGLLPDNPAELLSSSNFEKLLAKLSKEYDRILVDSPPVLPVADARILGAKCDYTLLVMRVDKSTVKRASQAREDLATLGAKILGSVINDMPKKLGYGYGYGYGNSYGYGGYGPATQNPPEPRVKKSKPRRIAALSGRSRPNGSSIDSSGARNRPTTGT